MCAGAIYWSGIKHVVYALPQAELKKLAGTESGSFTPPPTPPPRLPTYLSTCTGPHSSTFSLPCREVFSAGSLPVEVEGPFLVEEAKVPHVGYWTGGDAAHTNGPLVVKEKEEEEGV